MPIDDRTTNRSYQLPNAANLLQDDVPRLRAALQSIDADVTARPTMAEVNQLITDLIAGSPGALDTLNELAAAMGDDPNFAATVATQLSLKANLAEVWSRAEADARYVQGQVQTEMVFIATAGQSAFTLSTPVINKPSALVTVDGVVQPTSAYSLNQAGTVLTLIEAVSVGTVVRVLALGVSSEGAPADDSVTTAKLRDGAVTPAKLAQPMTLGSRVLTTSGTAFDFSGIPSWVKKITVTGINVSTSGTSLVCLRVGTNGGITSAGYVNNYNAFGGSGVFNGASASNEFILTANVTAADSRQFTAVLTAHGDNGWNFMCLGAASNAPGNTTLSAGAIFLSGSLDRIRVTTVNGADSFDAGSVNLLFE